mgnify:CR=1 FL=1
MVEGCFRLVVLLTEISHLFRMVVIVRKGGIDRYDCENKLIGGIYRCVLVIKDEFCNIEDGNTHPRDPRLFVESIRGLHDGNHLYMVARQDRRDKRPSGNCENEPVAGRSAVTSGSRFD